MNCLSQMVGFLTFSLEQLGLYEPEISVQEAKDRLSLESKVWEKFQEDRNEWWNSFQANNNMSIGNLTPLVEKAITRLESVNIQKGIAVDLGCGINSTAFNLLERGWKVYAVDSSDSVIQSIAQKVSSMGKTWIEDGQLVLVHQAIEDFEYPEKVHLVIATNSLPYCNPEKINKVFLEVKSALIPQGLLVCNLFPYSDNPAVDNMLRAMFGGWMTTKNVVEALIRSVDFSSWSVDQGMSEGGLAKQFHIIAQA